MKKEILEQMISDGLSREEMAKKTNCTKWTIIYWTQKYSIGKNKIKHIACSLCKKKYKKDEKRKMFLCDSCHVRIRRYRAKIAAIEYKGGKCDECNFAKHPAAMQFHHLKDKHFTLSKNFNKSWDVIKKELDKCQLLCSNCHSVKISKQHDEEFLKFVNSYNGRDYDIK